jgi:hypothetical protein
MNLDTFYRWEGWGCINTISNIIYTTLTFLLFTTALKTFKHTKHSSLKVSVSHGKIADGLYTTPYSIENKEKMPLIVFTASNNGGRAVTIRYLRIELPDKKTLARIAWSYETHKGLPILLQEGEYTEKMMNIKDIATSLRNTGYPHSLCLKVVFVDSTNTRHCAEIPFSIPLSLDLA